MPFKKTPAVAALLLALVVPAAAQAKAKPTYYVNLGDSYAIGWQRQSVDKAAPTHHGYADQTVTLARKKGYRFKLVNFGCGGATTGSVLHKKGCAPGDRALGGPRYTTTQIAAAEQFLRKHRGQIGLITVSISGNDVTSCAERADAVACVGATIPVVEENVTKLAKGLRKAAGKQVRIVGTTYPDVILGQWVHAPVNQDLAKLSVFAFQKLLNPGLQKAYASAKAEFVDVTKATGAYTPLDQMTTLAPYGTIPVAVAKVCTLTYYCQYGDIHSRTPGYGIIAKLIVATLPKAKH